MNLFVLFHPSPLVVATAIEILCASSYMDRQRWVGHTGQPMLGLIEPHLVQMLHDKGTPEPLHELRAIVDPQEDEPLCDEADVYAFDETSFNRYIPGLMQHRDNFHNLIAGCRANTQDEVLCTMSAGGAARECLSLIRHPGDIQDLRLPARGFSNPLFRDLVQACPGLSQHKRLELLYQL